MNAMRELEEVVSHDLDQEEKNRAMELLAKCDSKDPLVSSLYELFEKIDLVPTPSPTRLLRIKIYFSLCFNPFV